MKIAVWHNLPSGGGKRALYYHVRGLVERGHRVAIWCPPTADRTYLPLADLAPERVVPLDWPDSDRGLLGRAAGLARGVERQLAAMDRHCRLCAAEIEAGGFELLFANSCRFFRVTSIGRHVGLPAALYLQEPYRRLYEALPRLPWAALPDDGAPWRPSSLRRRLRDALTVRGLRVQAREEAANAGAFDAILVNSHFSRESVLRAYGLDARVCYLGIDTALFAARGLAREPFVIGLGAFVIEKNIALAIDALGMVGPPRPPLIWVGNVAAPEHLGELKERAARLGVDFRPLVGAGEPEVLDLLNRAVAMVYAPRLEPFGFAPLEANACGTPVIAVAEGGVRETILDGVNGLLVEHSPQAIARAIEQLRDRPAYARGLGENGARLVRERWSLGASIDRLEQRLAEVLVARAA